MSHQLTRRSWAGLFLVGLMAMTAGCKRNSSTEPEEPSAPSGPYVESEAGFSFQPPSGWTIKSAAALGMKYKVATGPITNGFAANINVTDEPFGGSLDAYVQGSLTTLKSEMKKWRVLKQGDFKTDSGLAGKVLIAENEQFGQMLRQSFYFFARKKMMFVVTCTVHVSQNDKFDTIFDASMKTFRFDKE